jgi:hypothetical protein
VVLPLQAPDQPWKVVFLPAFAVRVTTLPYGNPCEHVEPQLIPAGCEVTRPLPRPVLTTVKDWDRRANVATAVWGEFIVRTQVEVPEHAPDHPTNSEPAA